MVKFVLGKLKILKLLSSPTMKNLAMKFYNEYKLPLKIRNAGCNIMLKMYVFDRFLVFWQLYPDTK